MSKNNKTTNGLNGLSRAHEDNWANMLEAMSHLTVALSECEFRLQWLPKQKTIPGGAYYIVANLGDDEVCVLSKEGNDPVRMSYMLEPLDESGIRCPSVFISIAGVASLCGIELDERIHPRDCKPAKKKRTKAKRP